MYQILIAEDEPLERKVLCSILQKHFGDLCQIHEARSGSEAVACFLEHKPQVAILDIEMPGSTGLQAARQIRQSGHPCMILFLSAYDKFSYAREAISLRALDYLLKPYEAQELILNVEEALNLYARTAGTETRQLSAPQETQEEEAPTAQRMGQVRENIDKESLGFFLQEIQWLKEGIERALGDQDVTFTVSASW